MKYLIVVIIALLISGCAKHPMDDWKAMMAAPSPRYAPMPMPIPVFIVNPQQPVYREYPAFNNLYQNTQHNANRDTYITPCMSGSCY